MPSKNIPARHQSLIKCTCLPSHLTATITNTIAVTTYQVWSCSYQSGGAAYSPQTYFVSEDTVRPMAYARYVRNTSHAVLILPPSAMPRSNMCRPREKIISYHGFNKPHHPRARQSHNYTLYHTRNPRIQEPCLPTLPLTSPPSRSWI